MFTPDNSHSADMTKTETHFLPVENEETVHTITKMMSEKYYLLYSCWGIKFFNGINACVNFLIAC